MFFLLTTQVYLVISFNACFGFLCTKRYKYAQQGQYLFYKISLHKTKSHDTHEKPFLCNFPQFPFPTSTTVELQCKRTRWNADLQQAEIEVCAFGKPPPLLRRVNVYLRMTLKFDCAQERAYSSAFYYVIRSCIVFETGMEVGTESPVAGTRSHVRR